MLDFGPGSFFLSSSQLLDSPSARHGISAATEKALRLYACEIIQEAGILLRLSQAVAATAQVLLHRFFCKQSFRDFDARTAAASCFWLSMKLEEEEGASNRGRKPSQLNDVVSMFEHIQARREGTTPLPQHAPAFKIRKEEILKLETRILVELGFVCHVEHPHKILLSYLNCVLEAPKELIQECWNLVNDSLRTTMCVSFPSNVIACGIIYFAARRLCVPLPESPAWWLLFDTTLDQILKVCMILTDLYRQPKSQYVDVRTQSSKLVETASLPSEASSVAASSKSPESETSQLVPTLAVNDADVCSGTDVPVISLASASNVLNSCFMDASGLASLMVVNGAPAHQITCESNKRARESSEASERKSKRQSIYHERLHERCDRRKDRREHRHSESLYRGACRDHDRNSKRREDYSSYWSSSRQLVSILAFDKRSVDWCFSIHMFEIAVY